MEQAHITPQNEIVEHVDSSDCICEPAPYSICRECCGEGCTLCDGGIIEIEHGYIQEEEAIMWIHFSILNNQKCWPITHPDGTVLRACDFIETGYDE